MDEDTERVLEAVMRVLGGIQTRAEFAGLTPQDQARDKSIGEAARLSWQIVKEWTEDRLDGDTAAERINALYAVLDGAKGPIVTTEAFRTEFQKALRRALP